MEKNEMIIPDSKVESLFIELENIFDNYDGYDRRLKAYEIINTALYPREGKLDETSGKGLHKHVVNASAWIFDGKDPQGRDISIYIEAPDRESAIAYFETDYEGYRYWQTRQHLR